MNRDINTIIKLITPGGLVIICSLDQFPAGVKDHFKAVENSNTMTLERCIAYVSRLTGLRCTIEHTEIITSEPNNPLTRHQDERIEEALNVYQGRGLS